MINNRKLASEVAQLYWAIIFYNHNYERPYLTDLISDSEKVEDILADPSEHENDFKWICKICNTKGPDQVEEKRKKIVQEITELAKMGKIADISTLGALLPVSEIDTVAKEVMDFYHDYSPYDFAMSQDGWYDDTGEPTQSFEAAFQNNDEAVKDIFENLHAVIDCPDTEAKTLADEMEKERARNLIEHMRKFADDPVPTNLRVVLCDPRQDAETLLIPNSADMFKNFNGREMKEMELANGIWVAFDANGKTDNLTKNRTLYDAEGKKMGVGRGTMIFYSKNRYGENVNLTDSQYEQVMNMYGEAQLFKREYMTTERKDSLLKKTAEELSKDGWGTERMKRIGFTAEEIEELLPRQEKPGQKVIKQQNTEKQKTVSSPEQGNMRVR